MKKLLWATFLSVMITCLGVSARAQDETAPKPVEDNVKNANVAVPQGSTAKLSLQTQLSSKINEVGDEVIFSPSNKTAKIKTIEAWHVPEVPEEAAAGQSIGVTLTEQIFVERGEVMSRLEQAPIESNVFKAKLFWLGHNPLRIGSVYTLKVGTLEAPVTV